MKNAMKIALCIGLLSMLLLFAGCKKDEPAAPAPAPESTPEPEPTPVKEEVVQEPEPTSAPDTITSVKSAVGSDVTKTPEGPEFITDLDCDPAGTLSWALNNPTEDTYTIGRVSAMEASGLHLMRASINGRTIELPESCNNGETLAPGVSVDCSIEFQADLHASYYKVRTGVDTVGNPEENILNLKTKGVSHQWQFKCQ